MKFLKSSLVVFVCLVVMITFSTCRKKPNACMEVSNENPSFGETITISSGCSSHTKWGVYFVDGEFIGEGAKSVRFKCTTPGKHTIKMIAFSSQLPSMSMNNTNPCNTCSGSGKTSEISLVINVSSSITAQYNAPLSFDQDLQLSTPFIDGAAYRWTGPNNFISFDNSAVITNVNANDAGVYNVEASLDGKSLVTGSVNVVVLPVAPACAPINDQCTFTGGLPNAPLTNVIAGPNFEAYQIYSYSSLLDVVLNFNTTTTPCDGIYTIVGSSLNLIDKTVFMQVKPYGFYGLVPINDGKVYVTNVGGKLSVTFCSLPFSDNQTNYTITGKLTEQ
jgi:hypothetical protein